MKKSFFLIFVFFFSFSVSNLNLFAKTIVVPAESTLTETRGSEITGKTGQLFVEEATSFSPSFQRTGWGGVECYF